SSRLPEDKTYPSERVIAHRCGSHIRALSAKGASFEIDIYGSDPIRVSHNPSRAMTTSLEEALCIFATGEHGTLYLDVKNNVAPRELFDLLYTHGLLGRTVVIDSNQEFLRQMRAISQDIRLGLTIYPKMQNPESLPENAESPSADLESSPEDTENNWTETLLLREEIGFEMLFIDKLWFFGNERDSVEEFVRQMHAHDIQISAWVLNTQAEVSFALDIGVDNIVTDKPSEYLIVLVKRMIAMSNSSLIIILLLRIIFNGFIVRRIVVLNGAKQRRGAPVILPNPPPDTANPAAPQNYDLTIPSSFTCPAQHTQAETILGAGIYSLRQLSEEGFLAGQEEALLNRLRQLARISPRGPPQVYFVVTTDKEILQKMRHKVAAVNLRFMIDLSLPENTVFLHPYFFHISQEDLIRQGLALEQLQLKILYHELISHIAKGIKDEDEAMRDTEIFFAKTIEEAVASFEEEGLIRGWYLPLDNNSVYSMRIGRMTGVSYLGLRIAQIRHRWQLWSSRDFSISDPLKVCLYGGTAEEAASLLSQLEMFTHIFVRVVIVNIDPQEAEFIRRQIEKLRQNYPHAQFFVIAVDLRSIVGLREFSRRFKDTLGPFDFMAANIGAGIESLNARGDLNEIIAAMLEPVGEGGIFFANDSWERTGPFISGFVEGLGFIRYTEEDLAYEAWYEKREDEEEAEE
ncbi:MAG: hypothetical protein JW788_00360, partial [Candidatus Omnitrophica bacterium]|nr:hypothetical protein [Candidatus Omnitrophota bacterium]